MATPIQMARHLYGARIWVFAFLVLICFQQAQGLEQRFAVSVSDARMAMISEGVHRRAKDTKGSKASIDGPENNVDPSKMASQTLTATGLKMTLRGVGPLDSQSRMTWQDVTHNFIEADIWQNQKKMEKLELNVYFDSQDPPHVSRRELEDRVSEGSLRRALLNRLLQEQQLDITFDVDMVVQSTEPGNALNYVTNAFNTDQKRADYLQNLKASGDPAFASASMDANLVSQAAPATGGKTIGIIVGVIILVFIVVACVAYAIHGNKTSEASTQEFPDMKYATEDESSSPEEEEDPAPVEQPVASPRPSGSPRAEIRRNDDIPRTILVDDASTYFDGNISVAWSMDTENQTQISRLS